VTNRIDTTHAFRSDAKRLPRKLYGLVFRGTNRDGSTSTNCLTFESRELAFRCTGRAVRLGCGDVRLFECSPTWTLVDPAGEAKTARSWLGPYQPEAPEDG